MKVTIQDGYKIMVDGVQIGRFDGRKEVYVILGGALEHGTCIARFKRYLNKQTARSMATRWCKFVFSRLTADEVIDRLGLNSTDFSRATPMQVAWDLGYPKPVYNPATNIVVVS
jgi:hypothetical protein